MRKFLASMLSLLLFNLSMPSMAEAHQDTQDLENIIKNYIETNPEWLRDILTNLAVREHETLLKTGLDLVRDDEDDPSIGAVDADLTIYEFSDYNCGYCKRIFPQLQTLLQQDKHIRLVIKEFPILSPSSNIAAKAALAAHKQGKFTIFHTNMMQWRGQLDAEIIEGIAQKSGLNIDILHRDMESAETAQILERTAKAANALKLRGTPVLIIGEQIIPGAIPLNEILHLINEARTGNKS